MNTCYQLKPPNEKRLTAFTGNKPENLEKGE